MKPNLVNMEACDRAGAMYQVQVRETIRSEPTTNTFSMESTESNKKLYKKIYQMDLLDQRFLPLKAGSHYTSNLLQPHHRN